MNNKFKEIAKKMYYGQLSTTNNDNAREKFLKEILENIPAGLKILDAGAGQGRFSKYCKHLQYTSQDFCQYQGEGDGKGLQTGVWDTNKIDIVSDIISIPVDDMSYDIILCTEVLEHIPNPHLALKEFARILKPGGKLILTAPFNSLIHFAPYHFCSGFSEYWYQYHLEENNFIINQINKNGNWFSYLYQEVSRVPYMEKQYLGGGGKNKDLYFLLFENAKEEIIAF